MPSASVDKKKIIIIESDKFLADIYKNKFEAEGFKVTAVNDGERALKVIQTREPDIVLLSFTPSEFDGFSILRQLKKNKATKKLPVVLMTCLGSKEDVEMGLKLGAAGFFIKTHCKPAEIIEKVKQIIK